jgi:hypothetical protein
MADTVVGALDMADGRDRVLLRSKRWETTPEQRARYLKALDIALRLSLQAEDQRAINGCVKTIAMLEAQNQSDEHLEAKVDRLDDGRPTEIVVTYRQPELPGGGRFSDDFD